MNLSLDFISSALHTPIQIPPLTWLFETATRPITSHPHVQKATLYIRAAFDTFTDTSSPLKDVPKPVIDHKKFQFTQHTAHASKKTIIFLPGHETRIPDTESFIEAAYQANLSPLVVPLPEMNGHTHTQNGRRIDTVYRDHIKHALPKLFDLISKDQEIIILTHSSSGGALERAMQEDDSFSQLVNQTSSSPIIHLAAFFDTAKSSYLFNPVKSALYTLTSTTHRFWDKRTGAPPIDRLWLKVPNDINEAEYQASIQGNARHGQACFLKAGGQQHTLTVIDNPDSESCFQQIKRIFFHGNQDAAACHETVYAYANEVVSGAECQIIDGLEHDLLSSPRFRQELIQFIGDGTPPSRNHYAALDAPARRLQAA